MGFDTNSDKHIESTLFFYSSAATFHIKKTTIYKLEFLCFQRSQNMTFFLVCK